MSSPYDAQVSAPPYGLSRSEQQPGRRPLPPPSRRGPVARKAVGIPRPEEDVPPPSSSGRPGSPPRPLGSPPASGRPGSPPRPLGSPPDKQNRFPPPNSRPSTTSKPIEQAFSSPVCSDCAEPRFRRTECERPGLIQSQYLPATISGLVVAVISHVLGLQ